MLQSPLSQLLASGRKRILDNTYETVTLNEEMTEVMRNTEVCHANHTHHISRFDLIFIFYPSIQVRTSVPYFPLFLPSVLEFHRLIALEYISVGDPPLGVSQSILELVLLLHVTLDQALQLSETIGTREEFIPEYGGFMYKVTSICMLWRVCVQGHVNMHVMVCLFTGCWN